MHDEIVLVNYLKALFNSVRSSSLHVRNDVHAVSDANAAFVLERVRLCETAVSSLKHLNKDVKKTVVKSLKTFRKNILSVSARIWQQLFEETVVQPLEKSLLKFHSTKEEKTWVKTCMAIFRN